MPPTPQRNSSPTTPTATITTLPTPPIPWRTHEKSLLRTFQHRRRQHPTAPTGFGAIYYGTRYVQLYREVRGPAEDPADITRVVESAGGHVGMLRYGFPLGVHGQHGQYSGATTTTLDLTDPQQAEMLRWWEEQAVPPVEEEEEEEEDGLVEAERWMEEFVCWPRSPSPSSTFSQDADGNAIEDAWRHDDRSVAGVAQAQSQFQSQSPGVMGVNGNANANAASPPGTGSTCINKSPEPETPPHHPLPLPLPSMFPEEEDTTLQDGRCASPSYPRPPPPSMAGSPGPNGGGSGALRAGMATLSPQRTTIFLRDEEEGPDAISPPIDGLDPLTP